MSVKGSQEWGWGWQQTFQLGQTKRREFSTSPRSTEPLNKSGPLPPRELLGLNAVGNATGMSRMRSPQPPDQDINPFQGLQFL